MAKVKVTKVAIAKGPTIKPAKVGAAHIPSLKTPSAKLGKATTAATHTIRPIKASMPKLPTMKTFKASKHGALQKIAHPR